MSDGVIEQGCALSESLEEEKAHLKRAWQIKMQLEQKEQQKREQNKNMVFKKSMFRKPSSFKPKSVKVSSTVHSNVFQ